MPSLQQEDGNSWETNSDILTVQVNERLACSVASSCSYGRRRKEREPNTTIRIVLLFMESNVAARRLSGKGADAKKYYTISREGEYIEITHSFTQPLSLAYQQTLTLKRRNTC